MEHDDDPDEWPRAGPPRGILRGAPNEGDGAHERLLPSAGLAPFIEHYWWVRWNVPSPYLVETLPHPTVHLAFEPGPPRRAEVVFPSRETFARELQGEGWVFGIKFRPAMFSGLAHGAMGEHTGRTASIEQTFGADAASFIEAIFAANSLADRARATETFLGARVVMPPFEVREVRDLVERMAVDRTLIRAADAAASIGLGPRALESLFRRHVGVSPKWVIRRYRLHEAAARLELADPPSLATLAADLGYADQAHFTRDFKAATGRTPSAYRSG